MSDRIEKTLRSATRLQRTGEQLAALQIIEGMIRKHPANPRLINKRNFLCREITKSQADIDPPGFVLRKLAVLFDSSQWMELNHICREIIKLHPKSGQLINIYAVAKREIGDVDEALQLHRQAISLEPKNPSFLLNLGNSLVVKDAYDDAIACFAQVIKLDSNMATAYNSLGACYEDIGDNSAARKNFISALKVDPAYVEASYNLGAVELRDFDFEAGWKLRDFRWSKPDWRTTMDQFNKPMWSGHKTGRLFVWAEQGIGDEVMFASCLEDLFNHADELVVSVSKKSIKLFQRSFPNVEFVERETDITNCWFDDHIPAMSALGLMRSSTESFHGATPAYLSVATEAVRKIRNNLKCINPVGPIIGISWHSKAKRVGARRSISISDLIKLLPYEALIVNLQYGDVTDDISLAKTVKGREVHVIPDADLTNNMEDLCAAILACDSVVSIDNSTVHFAGALNKKCDVLLPYGADWRWGPHGTSKSYWYPSLNLVWQKRRGDWNGISENLSEIRY